MENLTTPEGVTKYLEQTTSPDDWNARVDEIKKANGGYPSWWYETAISSGLASRVVKDAGITVVSHHRDGTSTSTTFPLVDLQEDE